MTMKVSDLAQLYRRLRQIQDGKVPGKWVSAMQLANQIMEILAGSDAEVEIPPASGDLLHRIEDILSNKP